jgi:hypothetical protein
MREIDFENLLKTFISLYHLFTLYKGNECRLYHLDFALPCSIESIIFTYKALDEDEGLFLIKEFIKQTGLDYNKAELVLDNIYGFLCSIQAISDSINN